MTLRLPFLQEGAMKIILRWNFIQIVLILRKCVLPAKAHSAGVGIASGAATVKLR